MKFLITNDGPHPPEKWADVIVSEVGDMIRIESTCKDPEHAELEKLQFKADVRAAMERHFQEIDTGDNLPMGRRVEQAIADIAMAARGKRFAEHFLDENTIRVLNEMLNRRIGGAKEVARQWQDKSVQHSGSQRPEILPQQEVPGLLNRS